MKTISPESFAMICFLVLMQNGEGINDKSPDYISEKTNILSAGLEAFAYLDIYNMRKVIEWCAIWRIEVPNIIQEEMIRQNHAQLELATKGIFL